MFFNNLMDNLVKNLTSTRTYLRHGLLLSFVLLCIVLTTAGHAEDAPPKRSPTVISHIPWEPMSGSQPKVIYGSDDRKDLYEIQDNTIISWSRSVCGLVSATQLTQQASGNYVLSTSAYRQLGLPPCSDEPFKDQPTAPNCSGFMVGEDLIATAGHCYSNSNLSSTRFVFGFYMNNSTTPTLSFSSNQVYRGVEVVARHYSSDNDYSIIRVDRPITSPGARPLPLRREGTIAIGTKVGVIGHPAGLPMKFAFGNETVVRSSINPYFFVANLDTYGGNSGSPVFNQVTGIVEGILVRGDTDYIRSSGCFISNVLSNTGGRGEDVSKTTVFQHLIPEYTESLGELTLNKEFYTCFDSSLIQVRDTKKQGSEVVEVFVMVQSGDVETVTLYETSTGSGIFQANVPILEGVPQVENGIINVMHGDIVTVIYQDTGNGNGELVDVFAEATIDCEAPEIYNVDIMEVGSTWATIQFETSESTSTRVLFGNACNALDTQVTGVSGTTHEALLARLTPDSDYYFVVEATDGAGNTTVIDNGGNCFTFSTVSTSDYLTALYDVEPFNLTQTRLLFTPSLDSSGYNVCHDFVDDFTTSPYGGELLTVSDDGFALRQLGGGAQLYLFGKVYDSVYIGSNGYLTFLNSDTNYSPSLDVHFSQPRVSGLFADLNPEVRGSVYYEQRSNRVVISFIDVPVYSSSGVYAASNSNSFQVEMFYNGRIRITYLNVTANNALVGLSRGLGLPADYENSQFLANPSCPITIDSPHSADMDGDGIITMSEVLRVIQLSSFDLYHCDATSEGGYTMGSGFTNCEPHSSDFSPQNWNIGLGELLRLIQLYNAGGYLISTETEDGFMPVRQ